MSTDLIKTNMITEYLENQLKMLRDRERTFTSPIQDHLLPESRKMEALVLQRQIWLLEDLIAGVKAIHKADIEANGKKTPTDKKADRTTKPTLEGKA